MKTVLSIFIVAAFMVAASCSDAQTQVLNVTAPYMHHNDQITCYTPSTSAYCYDNINLMMGYGSGLINADYQRVENYGTGPAITRKTAVRGYAGQWAVWAEQINLGPGSKAALWISGDNPELSGLRAHSTEEVMVINSNLDVTNAVIQWNATSYSSGVFLRVFRDGKLVFEVTRDGTVRAKHFEVIP